MTFARDLVYSTVGRLAKTGESIDGGSDEDLYLHGLLNHVEDDRAHREAEKLRQRAKLQKEEAQ